MREILLAGAAMLAALPAMADGVSGRWKTAVKEDGRYLHVDVGPCAADAGKVCGIIAAAFGGASEANVGKPILWDMVPDGAEAWSGGMVWAPDDDKTYRSTMALAGDVLTVKGCVLGGLICRGQDWTRVAP